MGSQISNLKQRILGKRRKYERTELTEIMYMVREFGCLGEVMGRDFEVRNPEGELVYKIRQKPITANQLRMLLKELATIKELENEAEKKTSELKPQVRMRKK